MQNIENLWQKWSHIQWLSQLEEVASVISELISRCKDEYQNYIASRLSDRKTNARMYWFLLITFCSGKKVPIISPLLINNKLISDFEVKADYFIDFFESQCMPLNNNSKISETQSYVTNTSGLTLIFEHLPSRLSEISQFEIFSHQQEN